MLRDVTSIRIKGGGFEEPTRLSLFCDGNNPAKAVLLYGRNGSGKSTIARFFRKIKGFPEENIQIATVLNNQGSPVTLTDDEKAHVFVFDENFVKENVLVKEDGLGSIIMLGEKAGLTELIEAAMADFKVAEADRNQKQSICDEYRNIQNPKSPNYYINKMYFALQQDNGWAGRKRKIEDRRRNAPVNDTTYKQFVDLSPEKTRDELIIEFDNEWNRLEAAQSGASRISIPMPSIPLEYTQFESDRGNSLLVESIEHPELTEREQYLMSLVQNGQGDELRGTAQEFESPELTICPKCHQPLTHQYKADLVKSIQKVLSEEVKNHLTSLKAYLLPELVMDLEPFQNLSSFRNSIDQINIINSIILHNNGLLQSKIDDPYFPVTDELMPLSESMSTLEKILKQLENERDSYNLTVTDTTSIKEALTKINDEIAYWDVIELSKQYDAAQGGKLTAENDYMTAKAICDEKKKNLDDLNAQRDSINIAIDLINVGLNYIFFSNNRMNISVEDGVYRLSHHAVRSFFSSR